MSLKPAPELEELFMVDRITEREDHLIINGKVLSGAALLICCPNRYTSAGSTTYPYTGRRCLNNNSSLYIRGSIQKGFQATDQLVGIVMYEKEAKPEELML